MSPSIAEQFRGIASSVPDTVALTTARARYTYADLDRWSDAIAADVVAHGLPRDRAVAIVTADNVALVAAVLGVVKAGFFFVMIDASDPEDRVEWILRESNAVLRLEPRPFSRDSVPAPPIQPPHEFVHLVFTSGTTGKPKGVMTRQAGFVEHTLASSKSKGFAAGERTLYTALPGFTRAPLNIFGALLTGGTLCAFDARNESLAALADTIRNERITTVGLTPSFFRRLMTLPDLDLSSVRTLRLGADRVTVADVEIFKRRFPRGCILTTGFAATESGRVFSMRIDHDTPVPGPLVPMGRAYDDVDVRLLDEEGREVAVGETGEIVVRSAQVAEGYWNDPELTADRFRMDGLRTYFTGDLARRDEQGLYYFVGRKDARLKIHGRRIDPSEIEAAILSLGSVREVVVVGKTDESTGQYLVAYVVMQEGEVCRSRTLRAVLREQLPLWMIPSRIVPLDAIPLTRALKADRAALIARAEDTPAEDSGAADDLQHRLVGIWSRVTERAVHVDDDFFEDLGGESIVAAHLVTEVQRETGAAIPLSLLLELNSVAKMASFLRGRAEVDPVAVAVQPHGSRPPLFCISGAGGSIMVFRRLSRSLGNDQPFYGLHHHGFGTVLFPQSYTAMAAQYAEAIRRIQSRGPYFVAGYSSGGTLAFEVARQMERAGEPVAFVGLIDTAASRTRASRETRLRNRLEFLRQRPFPRVPRYLWEMIALRPWFHFKQWTRRAQKAPRAGAKAYLPDPALVPDPLHETNEALSEARRGFALQPYSGTVTLFRARHGVGAMTDERDLGWLRVGIGRLDIRDVEGDHRSILEEDVHSLGLAFANALAETQAR
ncbi:MAG: alpha/beta fold hydrolase [Acidobacteriota bacterium]